MPKKSKAALDLPDQRMFELIEWLKDKGAIRFRQEFCDALEMNKQAIRQIKVGEGHSHFTVAQIRKACEAYKNYVDVAWIMGFQDEMKAKKETRVRKVA